MNDKALYELFGAREIMDLPAAVYKTLFADIRERDEIYRRLLELYNYDITYDWFQELYEIEYAQRKKKQDFTPHSVTEIVSQIALEGKECTIHEPTAGTGGLIISAWWETIKNKIPWEIFPSKNMINCWELSDRSIPFLLLNMSIRGMMGYVYHGDVLEKKVVQKYILLNRHDDCLAFSEIIKANEGDKITEYQRL